MIIRKTYDTDSISKLFCHTRQNINLNVLEMPRVGKRSDGKPRPLKVSLDSTDEVYQILSRMLEDLDSCF